MGEAGTQAPKAVFLAPSADARSSGWSLQAFMEGREHLELEHKYILYVKEKKTEPDAQIDGMLT